MLSSAPPVRELRYGKLRSTSLSYSLLHSAASVLNSAYTCYSPLRVCRPGLEPGTPRLEGGRASIAPAARKICAKLS